MYLLLISPKFRPQRLCATGYLALCPCGNGSNWALPRDNHRRSGERCAGGRGRRCGGRCGGRRGGRRGESFGAVHGHVPIPTRPIGGCLRVGAAWVGSLRILLGGQCLYTIERGGKVSLRLRMGSILGDATDDSAGCQGSTTATCE